MNARSVYFVSQLRPAVLLSASPGHVFKRPMLLLLLLLVGCTDNVIHRTDTHYVIDTPPKEQVADYHNVSCVHLWRVDSQDAMNNALYWLRMMDCAGQLTPVQAREASLLLTGQDWAVTFKQGILLDSADASLAEQRQILEHINSNRQYVPPAVLPLLQVWSDKQNLRISLADEQLRAQRIQDVSDKQISELHEQQAQLQYQLETTTRKLESLTDIERQLSSRKQTSSTLSDGDEHQVISPVPSGTEKAAKKGAGDE